MLCVSAYQPSEINFVWATCVLLLVKDQCRVVVAVDADSQVGKDEHDGEDRQKHPGEELDQTQFWAQTFFFNFNLGNLFRMNTC